MPTINKTHQQRPWNKPRKAFEMKVDNSRFYNSTAWRKLSRAFKDANPLCVNFDVCGGIAHTADHIKPISEGGEKLDVGNLQSLCVSCNASKTSKQGKKNASRKNM